MLETVTNGDSSGHGSS